jgi:hypothetical protein
MSPARFRERPLALVLVILLLAAGCATSSKAKLNTSAGPAQRFNMTGSGFQTDAVITRDGAQGPQVNLGRYDNGTAIRGSAPGGTVNITVDEAKGHAQGIWGSGPITLDVTEQENQLQFNGLVNGRPSNWTASRERIEGRIGFCSYDLRGTNETYTGSRSCAGGISPVTVVFPSTILEWKPINIGLLMAMLMSTP